MNDDHQPVLNYEELRRIRDEREKDKNQMTDFLIVLTKQSVILENLDKKMADIDSKLTPIPQLEFRVGQLECNVKDLKEFKDNTVKDEKSKREKNENRLFDLFKSWGAWIVLVFYVGAKEVLKINN